MGPIRLVLADDTEPLRMLLRRIFEADPRFEVVGEAGDGVEAVELVTSLAPDLLLLDLSMPRLDGLEVLDRLRPANTSTRVVVLSGHAADAAAQASLERGALAYIEKGVRPVNLLSTIADLMTEAASGAAVPRTIRSEDQRVEPSAAPQPSANAETSSDQAADLEASRRLEPPPVEPQLDSLVSQLVHDLRSPLGLAVGYLDLLRRKDLGPEPTVLLDRVHMALTHLDELVTTLGAYARVGRTSLERTSVSVADACEAAMARLREQHGGHLDHVTIEDPDATIHADPTALQEVLYQLLDNAVRYGDEQPVAVRVHPRDESVVIEVADGGPGLADDDADALFGPFKRGLAARGNWGTGLGLPLAARLVDAMDGRIWATNGVAGGGSIFAVELPAGRYAEGGQSD